jgi:hypothetical protein
MEYLRTGSGAVGGASDPQAQARVEALRRRQLPENEIPVTVGWDVVLLEADDLVVFIAGARVYSTGVEFTVVVNARREDDEPHAMTRGLLNPHAGPDDLLLGVEYADGRSTSSAGGMHAVFTTAHQVSAEVPTLAPGGGGGGSRRATKSFFLSPLPPAGSLRIITTWVAKGFAERVVEMSMNPIEAAKPGVRRLWDVEPAPDRTPDPPQVPPGGWFERHQPKDGPPDSK